MQNTLANRQKPFSLRQMPTTLVLALTVLWLSACSSEKNGINEPLSCTTSSLAVWVAGGQFSMGSNTAYPEESPSTIAEVHGYWMDATEVTVGSFKAFVDATSYVTVAERSVDPSSFPGLDISTSPELAYLLEPGGAVFAPAKVASGQATNWWVYVPGANWRFPLGPDAPAAHSDEPVTQVALEDAKAYARWAGGRLPTEAEWEYAALGLDGHEAFSFAAPDNANVWQGIFPVVNSADDGFVGVAPAGCFPANGFGLHDMIGNVWEWTADGYHPTHAPALTDTESTFPGSSVSTRARVKDSSIGTLKGGSFLCAENYCRRYRPAARHPQESDLGTNHIGFRLVYDRPGPEQ